MKSSEYLANIQRLFSNWGWTMDISPAQFLDEWTSFVELCRLGYPSSVYEYFNDIRVREWIEGILASPELAGYPEHREFGNLVAQVDDKFRTLLQPEFTIPGKRFWWEGGVLRYAGTELVADLKNDFGFSIETRTFAR